MVRGGISRLAGRALSGTAKRVAVSGAGVLAVGAVHALLGKAKGWSISGKSVIVTGGSRGFGLILAREMAAQGARVAICARDGAELEQAYNDLLGRGGEILAVPCDVTRREDVERMVAQVKDRFGGIDALVNNAGVIQVGPLDSQAEADFEEAMKVHFWGPLRTTLAALPALRESGGRVLNVSSIGGRIAVPHLLPYSASKFALTGLSRGLHGELARDGVKVTTAYPWLMRTGSPVNAKFKGASEKEYRWFAAAGSLPGLAMDPGRAARKAISSMEAGEAEVVLGAPALAALMVHDQFTELFYDVLGMVNRLLPKGTSREARAGREVKDAQPSTLQTFTDRAARDAGEYVH